MPTKQSLVIAIENNKKRLLTTDDPFEQDKIMDLIHLLNTWLDEIIEYERE